MTAAATISPYVLRADGRMHTSDVRCVAYCADDLIASASRDQTAQLISLHDNTIADAEDKDELVRGFPITGHSAFVNFVLYHPGLPLIGGAPCLITGSNDNHVAVWSMEKVQGESSPACTLEAVLDGHAQGICAGTYVTLPDTSADGHLDVVTADWGGVCIVFDSRRGRPKQLYTKHTTAVRGVAHMPDTTSIVSCSGDKSIHQWDMLTGKTMAIFEGHEDVVQCICAIDKVTFATGSNDSTVRIWRTDTKACVTLTGHTSLVYTVAWHAATQELLSSSEDCTVCVWARKSDDNNNNSNNASGSSAACSFAMRQAIPHPCVVWSVAGVAGGATTGDILTGGADGVVRLWTRDDLFMASIEKLEHLEQGVSSQRMDVKVATAAGLDAAQLVPVQELHLRQGAREGDRVFAKNEAGTIEVYTWASGRWDKIGDVVAGPSQTPYTGVPLAKEKQYWNGKMYDYLFDVDVQGTMLKLPYNAGESILETARQFINDYPAQVSIDNLETIQQFLLEHIDPADLSKVPGLSQHASSPGVAAAMASAEAIAASQPGSVASPTAASAAELPPPWDAPEVFAAFKLDGALKKVAELLSTRADGNATCARAEELLRRVDAAARAGASSPASIANLAALCAELCHLFLQLPHGSRFPAIDALRYLIAQTQQPCLVDVVLQNVSELLATSVTVDNDGGVASLASGDAESLVWLRLTACLVAALAAQPTAIPGSAAQWPHDARTASAVTYLFDKLPRAVALASSPASVKAALTAVVRNEVVLARRVAGPAASASAAPFVQWLITSSALPVVAQRLALEPAGSPVVHQDLVSLWTLFSDEDKTATATAARHMPWMPEAKAAARRLLLLALQGLASGADAQARPLAKKVQALLAA